MADQADIVVYDGLTGGTPALHTFKPISSGRDGKGESIALWREQNASLPNYAQGRITQKEQLLPKSRVHRVSCRIEIPVMEAAGAAGTDLGYIAAPKVAYTNTIEIVGLFHERSTANERQLIRLIASNLLNGKESTTAVVNTGSVPILVDQLVVAD